MISVLIPVYNYNIVALVKALHQQLMASHLTFEIIAWDDFSKSQFNSANSEINHLSHTYLEKSSENYGRSRTRQLLSSKAKYDWLLFLDADVMPETSNYIQNYVDLIPKDYDAIYGGFSYALTPPEANHILRWKYGRKHEAINAKTRNEKPYKIVISANFIIKKNVFNFINFHITESGYGYDNYFGALLKQHKTTVFHIDNPVRHLGIESSSIFLYKIELAADTLLKLYQNHQIKEHENDLLSFFINLKRYRLHYLFSQVYEMFANLMRKNLISENPSIRLMQLYRISYMCNQFNLNKTK